LANFSSIFVLVPGKCTHLYDTNWITCIATGAVQTRCPWWMFYSCDNGVMLISHGLS
jgi:hypothetical protein